MEQVKGEGTQVTIRYKPDVGEAVNDVCKQIVEQGLATPSEMGLILLYLYLTYLTKDYPNHELEILQSWSTQLIDHVRK